MDKDAEVSRLREQVVQMDTNLNFGQLYAEVCEERDAAVARAEAAEAREAVLREALQDGYDAVTSNLFGDYTPEHIDAMGVNNAGTALKEWAIGKADATLANPSPRAEELLAAEERLAAVADRLMHRTGRNIMIGGVLQRHQKPGCVWSAKHNEYICVPWCEGDYNLLCTILQPNEGERCKDCDGSGMLPPQVFTHPLDKPEWSRLCPACTPQPNEGEP